MSKILLVFLLFFAQIYAKNIKSQIKHQQKTLSSAQKQEQDLNQKLEDIAKLISKEEKTLDKTIENINTLKEQIKDLESKANLSTKSLENLHQKNTDLENIQKDMERKLIRIIAEEFALDLVKDKDYQDSIESIMVDEILDKVGSVIKENFIKLAKEYTQTGELISIYKEQINEISTSIKTHKQKQLQLKSLQKKQEKTILSLEKSKKAYIKRLDRIHKQQDELKKTLANLKILELKEIKKKQKKQKEKDEKAPKDESVRKIGSSYQKSKVKKYKGVKTIAPLDDYIVKQKFGNYTDPIYNIKIFNESVVLKSNKRNAKVKNVLDGKIVFAKEAPMLNNVVIVENSNGIHTIYAHLDKIAPTIKVGKKIKKGYVIGRIKQDLTFEVTQKNYHIDPLELIR